MVDAGSRAASVTIHTESWTLNMDWAMSGEIMLNTLLVTGPSTVASQTLSEPIQKELFEIKGFDVVLLPRVSVLTLSLGTRPGKQQNMG